ncbi:hypothetical protein SKA34_04790 [Photobacterium sp. SKA34]|nr:hypothetical protein SKA34_04790 [Photobacterium sp. SKA34]
MKRYFTLMTSSFFLLIISIGYYINLKDLTSMNGFWHSYKIQKSENTKPNITERNLKIENYLFKSTITNKGGNDNHIMVYEYSGKLNSAVDNHYYFSPNRFSIHFSSSNWYSNDLSELYRRMHKINDPQVGRVIYYDDNASVIELKKQQSIIIYTRLT